MYREEPAQKAIKNCHVRSITGGNVLIYVTNLVFSSKKVRERV